MKKFSAIISLVLVIAMLACLLTSCGASKLKGTWKSSYAGTITFKSGGKGTLNEDQSFKYSVSGKKLKMTITRDGKKVKQTFTFSVKDDTLTLKRSDGSTMTFTKVKKSIDSFK